MSSNQKIWIFGDSFASHEKQQWTWPNRISKDFRTENFAAGGTSIDWSVQQLLNAIDKNKTKLKDITVLFFLTDISRINFKFWKELHHQVLAKRLYYPDNGVEEMLKNELEMYSNKQEFIHSFFQDYLLHGTYTRTEEQKCVLLLNHYAKLFKKLLIWRPFYGIQEYPSTDDFTLEKNCKVIDIPLDTFTKSVTAEKFTVDNNPNHLDKKNHFVMHSIISDYIQSDVIPTIELWKEKIRNN